MKIIFFGLGSIGNRQAKILTDNYNHQVFAYRAGKGREKNQLGLKEVYTWAEVDKIGPEAAFITNPTFLHIDTAIKCARRKMSLFIEKPIGSSAKNLNILLKEVSERKLTAYVAYVLRFHPVIVFLKKYLKSKNIYHVSVYNSSYLPSWRPDQNHLQSYSAQAQKGGGVVLELSHEFDYIEYLFGNIEKIEGTFARVSKVTRDSEDFMDGIISTKRTRVNLHQNFLSLNKERIIKIDCKDEFIFADLIRGEVKLTKLKRNISKKYEFEIDEIFKKQMDYFFDNITDPGMMNNLNQASKLFKKILRFKNKKI